MSSPNSREREREKKPHSFLRKARLAQLGLILAASLAAASAPAQGKKTISRRTLSLWVQGQYGSDSATTGAPWMNPRCTGGGNGCNPTIECKPNLVILTTGQVLLHAPWPFKTINQPGGALSYIPTPLPYSGPAQWEYAIIHVLPGLYARDTAYGPAGTHNPDNGLQPNGEKFPIYLPPGVSIQGTSALNTVFDVTSPGDIDIAGPAFEFGNGGATGQDSFIDSIAIFGADTEESAKGNAPPTSFSAIALSREFASAPTISNCFLYGNGIGILVDAKAGKTHDGTKLFNNTIAFNHVGLWNGDSTLPARTSKGISKLILVNNIFDSSPEATPFARYPTNWTYFSPNAAPGAVNNTGFEGIALVDLQVSPTGRIDSNAYERSRFNSGVAHPRVNLPATTPRITGTWTPTHDIRPYTRGTGSSGVRRGILYVRDALTKTAFMQDTGSSPDFDQSPHDFRLSPAVALANNTEQTLSALNPMVNAGWGGSFPMQMANTLWVDNAPGYLPLGTSQNTWAFHNWNWDGEGYGNPRIQKHGSFYSNSGGFWMDIGADELGQLVAVGYRFATTHFMDVAGRTSTPIYNAMNNKYLWFLGPPTGLVIGGGPSVPPPTNASGPWFRAIDHITPQPVNYFAPAGSNPAYYAPWFSAWSFTNATTYYFPTVADVTPHLLDDPHPWWKPAPLNLANAANPIWQTCIAQYNPWLYENPSFGRINPGGSYKGDSTNFQWLDATWTVTSTPALNLIQAFGVSIAFRTTTNGQHAFYDAWGRGKSSQASTAVVDTFLPTYTGSTQVALRYCLEHKTAPPFTSLLTDTNLQSFMVLVKPASQ